MLYFERGDYHLSLDWTQNISVTVYLLINRFSASFLFYVTIDSLGSKWDHSQSGSSFTRGGDISPGGGGCSPGGGRGSSKDSPS